MTGPTPVRPAGAVHPGSARSAAPHGSGRVGVEGSVEAGSGVSDGSGRVGVEGSVEARSPSSDARGSAGAPPSTVGPSDTALRLDVHLIECRRPRGPVAECRWCHWALADPVLRTLIDVHHDARMLLSCSADRVPWVVAVTDLLALRASVDLDTITVPSVPSVSARVDRVRSAVAVDLASLDARLRAAAKPGGPIEQRCLATAGLLASVALQRPEHATARQGLDPSTRAAIDDAARQLSPDTQLSTLLPLVEERHRPLLPVLRTQPAWSRRAPGVRAAPTARDAPVVEPGSLEALVVEAVADRVVDRLAEVAPRLGGGARIRLVRPAGTEPLSERTRLTVWRIARIDWHVTLVDTGRADCWDSRVERAQIVTDVPWAVALAIDVGRLAGLTSATHAGWPDGIPPSDEDLCRFASDPNRHTVSDGVGDQTTRAVPAPHPDRHGGPGRYEAAAIISATGRGGDAVGTAEGSRA